MDRILSWLCAMILAGGGSWFLASSDVSFTVPAPIRWVLPTPLKHFSTPGSQRDEALAQTQKATASEHACQVAIQSQNASIDALSKASMDRIAAAAKAEADARIVANSYRQASARLSGYVPRGTDELSRWKDADREVVGSLQ